MRVTGQAKVSVTDSADTTTFADASIAHTLINDGSGLIAYRWDRKDYPSKATLAGASEAVLRGVGGAILAAGESVIIPAGIPEVDMACPTGVTATVRIEPGEHQATLSAIAGGVGVIDLSATDKSYTHTTAGTAEEVTGLTAGDVYAVDALTDGIKVGSSKALAEAAVPVQGEKRVRVPAGATSFWIDCSNSGSSIFVRKVN